MEEVFKGLAKMMERFEGVDKIAKEGILAIDKAVKGQDLNDEQLEQLNTAKAEVYTQINEYKKQCQLLSQIENTQG